MHRNFIALPHTEQNLFLHNMVMLPFELLDNNDFELANLEEDQPAYVAPVLTAQKSIVRESGANQPQEGAKPPRHRFNMRPWELNEPEKYTMKVEISK